jgi:hypothetical protein
MKKSKIISDENKKEIFYNIVNSLLAGTLVFLGSISSGNFTLESLFVALGASLIVAITKFKNYWDSEKKEYSAKFLNFI